MSKRKQNRSKSIRKAKQQPQVKRRVTTNRYTPPDKVVEAAILYAKQLANEKQHEDTAS